MSDEQLRLIASMRDRLSPALRRLGAVMRATNRQASFQKLTKEMSLAERSAYRLGFALTRNVHWKAIAASVGVGALSAAMIKLAKDSADTLGDQIDLAKQINFSAESLRLLEGVAKRYNVSQDTLRGGLEKFNASFGRLKQGQGAFLGYLQKTNPALAAQFKQVGSTQDAFILLSDAIAKTADPAKRAALVKAAGLGQEFLRFFADGPEDLKNTIEIVKRLLGLIGPKGWADADKFGEKLDDAGLIWQGLREKMATSLFSVGTPLLVDLNDFLVKNRDGIARGFEAIATDIGDGLRKVGTWVATLKQEDINKFWDEIKKGATAFDEVAGSVRDLVVAIKDLGGWKAVIGAFLLYKSLGGASGMLKGGGGILGDLLGGGVPAPEAEKPAPQAEAPVPEAEAAKKAPTPAKEVAKGGFFTTLAARLAKAGFGFIGPEAAAIWTTRAEDAVLAEADRITAEVRSQHGDDVLQAARKAFQPWWKRGFSLDSSDSQDTDYVRRFLNAEEDRATRARPEDAAEAYIPADALGLRLEGLRRLKEQYDSEFGDWMASGRDDSDPGGFAAFKRQRAGLDRSIEALQKRLARTLQEDADKIGRAIGESAGDAMMQRMRFLTMPGGGGGGARLWNAAYRPGGRQAAWPRANGIGAGDAAPRASRSGVSYPGMGMLDLIASAEGTGDNYNETLGYGRFTGGKVNLTGMTLDQIDALQTKMLQHPGNSFNSSAVGRYQFVRTRLRDLRKRFNLPGSALFSKEMQDALARASLAERGHSVESLRGEWEGLRRVPAADLRAAMRRHRQHKQQARQTVHGSASVDIRFPNGVPAGTKVGAKAKGLFRAVNLDTGRSMKPVPA